MFESEERIAERIKDFIKSNKNISFEREIMLRNERILDIDNYRVMVNNGKITPQDAYVDIDIGGTSSKAEFHYPFLFRYDELFYAYFSKLGFYYDGSVFPATGLKYVAVTERYEKYLSVEVSNLDTAVNNTNLRTVTFEVVGDKIISRDRELSWLEYFEIRDTFKSQRLFAGHNFVETWRIIYNYYNNGDQSLTKEVARIAMDYYRIFQPYIVCYNIETWKEIDCSTIK